MNWKKEKNEAFNDIQMCLIVIEANQKLMKKEPENKDTINKKIEGLFDKIEKNKKHIKHCEKMI